MARRLMTLVRIAAAAAVLLAAPLVAPPTGNAAVLPCPGLGCTVRAFPDGAYCHELRRCAVAVDAGAAVLADLPVRVRTVGGTATPGLDYVPFDTIVVIPAGEHAAEVALALLPDDRLDDGETVVLSVQALGSPVVTLGTVTIADSSSPPNGG